MASSSSLFSATTTAPDHYVHSVLSSKAISLHRQHYYTEAIDVFSEIIKNNPAQPALAQTHLFRGMSQLMLSFRRNQASIAPSLLKAAAEDFQQARQQPELIGEINFYEKKLFFWLSHLREHYLNERVSQAKENKIFDHVFSICKAEYDLETDPEQTIKMCQVTRKTYSDPKSVAYLFRIEGTARLVIAKNIYDVVTTNDTEDDESMPAEIRKFFTHAKIAMDKFILYEKDKDKIDCHFLFNYAQILMKLCEYQSAISYFNLAIVESTKNNALLAYDPKMLYEIDFVITQFLNKSQDKEKISAHEHHEFGELLKRWVSHQTMLIDKKMLLGSKEVFLSPLLQDNQSQKKSEDLSDHVFRELIVDEDHKQKELVKKESKKEKRRKAKQKAKITDSIVTVAEEIPVVPAQQKDEAVLSESSSSSSSRDASAMLEINESADQVASGESNNKNPSQDSSAIALPLPEAQSSSSEIKKSYFWKPNPQAPVFIPQVSENQSVVTPVQQRSDDMSSQGMPDYANSYNPMLQNYYAPMPMPYYQQPPMFHSHYLVGVYQLGVQIGLQQMMRQNQGVPYIRRPGFFNNRADHMPGNNFSSDSIASPKRRR